MRIRIGPDVAVLAIDAFGLVGAECRGIDVIIDASSTASAQAYRHLHLVARLGRGQRDQVAVFPSQTFAPGDTTGYVLGCDERLVAPDGPSKATTDTMAVAILDSSKSPPIFASASPSATSAPLPRRVEARGRRHVLSASAGRVDVRGFYGSRGDPTIRSPAPWFDKETQAVCSTALLLGVRVAVYTGGPAPAAGRIRSYRPV